MTGLQYLYLPDGSTSDEGEYELLKYLHTPNLKSLQVSVGVFVRWENLDRRPMLFHDYLGSLSSLERFGTTGVQERYKMPYLALLNEVLASQPNLRTLAVWSSWYAFSQLFPGKPVTSRLYQPLERIEANFEPYDGSTWLFRALGSVVRTQSGSKSSVATLSIGQTFSERQYFDPSEICTIVSTILYVHQKRLRPETPFTIADNESQTSPLVETPARRALFDSILVKRSWFRPFGSSSGQRNAVERYLHTLVSSLPLGRQKWIAKVSEWDSSGLRNKQRAINGICETVIRDPHEGFKRLELEWKASHVGRRWPKDTRDCRFVWEKTEAGWELLEST